MFVQSYLAEMKHYLGSTNMVIKTWRIGLSPDV